MKRFFNYLMIINDAIGIFSLLLMCAAIFFQIIARYIFSKSMPWPEDAGRIFFIICAYASIIYTLRKDGHLRIEILQEIFPGVKFFTLQLSRLFISAYFFVSVLLIWKVLRVVYRMQADLVSMPIPLWVIWAIILAFCFLIAVMGLVKYIEGLSAPVVADGKGRVA